ncbi:MAG: hypothetical protein ACE5KM_24065 [Planctomycetaceae bacterium]
MFASPAISLRQRNRFFGLSGGWGRTKLRVLNSQLVTLSRVVIHPTYRGAGVASAFIRRSCELCKWPWIEALAQMGHMHPFFEKAGFVRVGVSRNRSSSREQHSALYGGGRTKRGKRRLVTRETNEKSRFAQPVYYVFDNRPSAGRNPVA